MKIIFIKDLPGQGRKGEVKDVSEGYANNFLIAKGFAQAATADIQAKVAKEKKEAEVKKQKETSKLEELKKDLEKRTFVMQVKIGDKGQVFGGVHEKDIAAAVSKKINHPIEKNQVSLVSPVKLVGEHQIKIKLGSGITATTKIKVEAI